MNSYWEKQSKKGLVVSLIRYCEAGNENVIFILAQFKKDLSGVKCCLCIVRDKYTRRDGNATPGKVLSFLRSSQPLATGP